MKDGGRLDVQDQVANQYSANKFSQVSYCNTVGIPPLTVHFRDNQEEMVVSAKKTGGTWPMPFTHGIYKLHYYVLYVFLYCHGIHVVRGCWYQALLPQ